MNNTSQETDALINSISWLTNEADKIIALYKSKKTEHARMKLIPKIRYIKTRLTFEKRQIEKMIGV